MYCQNCGAVVTGNFCSNCGAKVIVPADAVINPPEPAVVALENKYESLIKQPEVRNLIAKYAQQSPHTLSAQDFLQLADLAYKPIPGVSFSKLSEAVVPIFTKLGIHTGKSFEETISATTSDVIVKVLCSLAKNGYTLKTVDQATNGIIVHAEISSDFWTWGGDLLLVIEECQLDTKVKIDVKIKGQLYDWGKSKGVIDKIVNDINTIKI